MESNITEDQVKGIKFFDNELRVDSVYIAWKKGSQLITHGFELTDHVIKTPGLLKLAMYKIYKYMEKDIKK
jgi:hypothetical protein